jgi:Fur family ferric uptake transcriptional regulator
MEGKDLRKAGLKVTLPRLKILEILERSSTRHLSAEDIYRSLLESNEDIGLATVYRVLTQFEAASLVTRHHFEDGMAVFELNEGTHHDHIVCLDCGRVEEFTEEGIEARQTAVARRLGFEIREHSLILYGHCRKNPLSVPQESLLRLAAPLGCDVLGAGAAAGAAARSISPACARAFAVTSMPPSMRASSSTRSSAESCRSWVRVVRPSLALVTRRC